PSVSPIDLETKCSLSQYCAVLVSAMRLSVIVDGAAKSVGSTGSQITNTRIFPSRCSSSSFWNAEAPCKQTVQVGESITITRTESAESLKDSFNESMFALSRRTNGCCPAGAVLPKYR